MKRKQTKMFQGQMIQKMLRFLCREVTKQTDKDWKVLEQRSLFSKLIGFSSSHLSPVNIWGTNIIQIAFVLTIYT